MDQDEFIKKVKLAVDAGSIGPRHDYAAGPMPWKESGPIIIPADEARARRASTQCANKSRYPSEDRAMRYAQESANRIQSEIVIYECDLCNQWHLSSKYIPPKYLNGRPKAQSMVFPRKVK